MCGLCGVLSTTVSNTEFEKFIQLFNVSSLRGEHSSGLFSVKEIEAKSKHNKDSHKYSTTYIKGVGPSGWFAETNWKAIKERVHDSADTVLVAGHCRHATRGTVSSANSHPFNFSNLIGMHNGTLSDNIGPKITKKDKKGHPITVDETDSESFYRFLNDHTLEEALAELRPHGDAFAFVWYDKVKRTLNFFRNDKRPLWIAQVNASTIYWASEKEMLQFILNRSYGGGYVKTIDKLGEIPVNTLVSYKVDAVNPVQACSVRKIDFKPKYSYTPPHRNGGFNWTEHGESWYQGFDREPYDWKKSTNNHSPTSNPDRPGDDEIPFDQASGATTTNSVTEQVQKHLQKKHEDKLATKSNVITLPFVPISGSVRLNSGGELTFKIKDKEFTRKAYEERLNKGCAWCTQQSLIGDTVSWQSYDEYICADCAVDPEVRQYLTSSH